MKLPALPVHDPLSTLNFEAIQKHDLSLVQSPVVGSTPKVMTFGVGTVTFSASQYSALLTVTHSLGATPAAVLLTPRGHSDMSIAAYSITATTFDVQGFFPAGAATGPVDFSWLALG